MFEIGDNNSKFRLISTNKPLVSLTNQINWIIIKLN